VEHHCKAVDMKIGHKNDVDQAGLVRRVAPDIRIPSGRNGTAAERTTADSVQVSDVARALAKLIGGVGTEQLDPARAAQVAVLRNAVASGRYTPDLHGVARKLLADVAPELLA
jgi:anti-sigma28 factor (negative regulator of flagellin synthesis)